MPWRFRVLGTLEIIRDGEPVDLRSPRASALLRTLLLHGGRPVPFHTLVDEIWDVPPADGRNSLHVLVRRLRRALGDDTRVLSGPEGYRVRLEPGELDATEFEARLAAAEGAAADDDVEREYRHLDAALRLWPTDAPARQEHAGPARDLVERRVAAWYRRAALDLDRGRAAVVADDLRRLTRRYPLRERLWALLMTALQRAGRQAEALAAYAEARDILADRLGSDPGADLEGVYSAVLADVSPDPVPAGDPTGRVPGQGAGRTSGAVPAGLRPAGPVRTHGGYARQDDHGGAGDDGDGRQDRAAGPDRRPDGDQAGASGGSGSGPARSANGWAAACQLPATTADFVGRTEEVADLVETLRPGPAARTALVWGPPAVGKSTLALRVAHELRAEHPDGQWHLVLGDREPDELLADLLLLSGMPPALVPPRGQARAAAFRARLAGRRVLLVLDGATSAGQVIPLLPGTTTCTVLLTAQNAMATLPGVIRRRLDPLPYDDGVRLLERVVGTDRVAAEPAAAVELVRLCGALPLAVRVVAARLLVRPDAALDDLVVRLRDERTRLDELAADGLEVRAGLRLSYAALDERLRTALRRTALLPRSGFAPWALAALTGDDGERLAERLGAAGLLQDLGRDAAGQSRQRCHDLVALYVDELAAAEPLPARVAAVDRLLDALAGHGATVAAAAGYVDGELPPEDVPGAPAPRPLPGGTDPDAWITAERATIRAAVETGCRYGRHARAAHVADLVVPSLAVHGDFEPLRGIRTAVRDAARAAGDDLLAWRAEYGLAEVTHSVDLEHCEQAYVSCVEAFERLGAVEELVHGLSGLSFCLALRGRPDLTLAARVFELGRTSSRFATRCTSARTYGMALERADRTEEALAAFQEALADAELGGVTAALVLLARDVARCHLAAGDLDHAAAACATAFAAEPEDTLGRAWLLVLHGRIETARGDADAAVAATTTAYLLMERLGNVRGAGSALYRRAEAHLGAGRTDQARHDARSALPMLEESGEDYLAARAGDLIAATELVEVADGPVPLP